MNLFPTPSSKSAAVEELHAATAIYTVSEVVDPLLDRLNWPQCGGRLLDPSAGDGSFLLQALKRLDAHDQESIARVTGWEIHPGAVSSARIKITQHLVRAGGWSWDSASRIASQLLINKDFLTDGPTRGEYRVIAGNPPYLRFQRLPDYFKNIYGGCLPKYARGDLLHAFLDWCTKLLPEDGAIGFVCSDRFLFNANAADLRGEIGNRVSISHLARLDPSSSFYRPKVRVKGTPPRIHPVEVVLHPLAAGRFPITRAAISPDDVERKHENGRTLSDIAKVSIAPWLGPLGIFVVTGADVTTLRRGRAKLIPAVDTDDIDPRTDQLGEPTRFAILTTREKKPVAAVVRHLNDRYDRMPQRGRNRVYWMPPETISMNLEAPSILVPRIARRIRAVILPAGVLPLNHNLSVVSTSSQSLNELRDLLLSERCQAWVKNNAPRLESGFLSITTSLLRRMPIEL